MASQAPSTATNMVFPGQSTFGRFFGRFDPIWTGHAQELDIQIICANSPQAKGRVERVTQTLYDRLPKELRLRGTSSREAGNIFLPEYMADFNRRFAAQPNPRKGGFHEQVTQLFPFVRDLFDDQAVARKATRIIAGIMKAHSPRMTEIARAISGNEDANYKCIQRFLDGNDMQGVLLRFFREQAAFVIEDPTEMPRPQAKHTEYVSTLRDGETRGYWVLELATPYHGRAIPCGFVSFSSKTINQKATSRNQHNCKAFAQVKDLLGDRPLVLDRTFSYLELLENLVKVRFTISVVMDFNPSLSRG